MKIRAAILGIWVWCAIFASAGNVALQLFPVPCTNAPSLQCYLYKPPGNGPFPAIVWNHESDKKRFKGTSPYLNIARFFTEHGFVFAVPMRASETTVGSGGMPYVQHYEMQVKQVRGAVEWLKTQSIVNENRVVMIGNAAGGTVTLVYAGTYKDLRACITFSAGGMSWNDPDLRNMLTNAISKTKSPLFLLQPSNDHFIGATQNLGALAVAKDHASRFKIFPPYGKTENQAHTFGIDGISIWGPDVLSFIDCVMP